jgi:hypothetical protein
MCVAKRSTDTIAIMLPSGGGDRLATRQSHKTKPVEMNKTTKDHVHLPVVSCTSERVVDLQAENNVEIKT